jgi:hypothetical protein
MHNTFKSYRDSLVCKSVTRLNDTLVRTLGPNQAGPPQPSSQVLAIVYLHPPPAIRATASLLGPSQ